MSAGKVDVLGILTVQAGIVGDLGLRVSARQLVAVSDAVAELIAAARAAEDRLIWGMDRAESSLQRKVAMNDAVTVLRAALAKVQP